MLPGQFSTAAPHWPKPTQDSEKQRCNTIKLCLQSLEQAEDAPDVDPRRKQGYDQSVATIVEEISQAVEKVATLGLKEQQVLNDLIRLAARLWLDICSQRYRILVVLPNSSGNVLKVTKGGSKSLKLVVKPEIRRIGNSHGQELAKEEIIGGWNGADAAYESR